MLILITLPQSDIPHQNDYHHIHHLNGKLKNQIEADLREHHNSGCVKSNKCKNAKQFDQVMSNISENANEKEFFGHECLF